MIKTIEINPEMYMWNLADFLEQGLWPSIEEHDYSVLDKENLYKLIMEYVNE